MSEVLAVVVPRMNPNDDHAVLVRWQVSRGGAVVAGQPLVTLETTKATFDVEAPRAGYAFFDHPPKALVDVGEAIAWIADTQTAPDREAISQIEPNTAVNESPRFTRKALRLMQQHGLRPADFAGTKRIEASDVEYLRRERKDGKGGSSASEGVEVLEQSPAKTMEARTLASVYRDIVPSMVSVSVSCAKLDGHLCRLAAEIGPISLLELAIHEVAELLEEFPRLNGFHAEGQAWHYTGISIGFAIDLGRSLRVPVVRDAAVLSQLEIARTVRDLSLRYVRDELRMEDVTGGTFTISDLSAQEVEHFIPVVNQRQAAILGLCAERPDSGRRDLTLSFDHRMTDGVEAARFLTELRQRLESAPV